MKNVDHVTLIESVNAADNPAKEAMAVIGSMSGVLSFEVGGTNAARLLRMCADLTERWPDAAPSLEEFDKALKELLQ